MNLRPGRFNSNNTIGWIVAAIMLFPFFIISLYNHPVGDDYWCTTLVRKVGYWNAQVQLYDVVPPRYTDLALSCLTPLSFGNFWGYKIIPATFIILFICIIGWLFNVLSGDKLTLNDRYLFASLFTGVYLAVLPGIGEGIYWASALSVYHTGIVLFIVWITLLFKWYLKKERGWRIFFATCLCLAGIMGCNEIIAIISFATIGWVWAHRIFNKSKPDSLLITMSAVVCLCFVIIMNFKGVGNRYSLIQTDTSGKLLYAGWMSVLGVGYYIMRCLLNPFFWAAVFAIAGPFHRFSRLFYNNYTRLFDLSRYFFTLWISTLFVIFFVIIFLSGLKPPLRISNMAVFFFLIGLIYFITLTSRHRLASRFLQGSILSLVIKYKNGLLLMLLIVGFVTKNNVSVAASELLSGQAHYYNEEMNNRYILIRSCTGDTCYVPPLRHIPVTLRYSVEDRDPHISEYFGKKIIVSGK